MRKLICTLALLFMVACAHGGQTFNTWGRGYITTATYTSMTAVGTVDVYAPIVDGDTINVRGIMLGFQAVAHGQDHSLQMTWREPGADGWERWDEWTGITPTTPTTNWPVSYGLPLPSRWQGMGGINGIGCTPFIPMSNVRELRLYNPSAFAAMHVVILWFMDEQSAKAADWSSWEMR